MTVPPQQSPDSGPVREVKDDRSVGELFADVSGNLSTLLQQEVALAKAEVQQSAKRAGKGAGLLGGAALAGNFVLLFASLALWWALGAMIGEGDEVPALGWSALIVMAFWAIIAAVLALAGRKSLSSVDGIPQTTQTVQKIPDALKGHDS